jgi:sarcosine oxidase
VSGRAPSGVFDVAVVGLGASGGAALYHLARRGLRVIGLERASPGHEGGSSHGESRIIRLAYFEHPSYVRLAQAAYAGWRTLEAETGRSVITVTGILEAGHPGSELVEATLASAREHGLAHEVLSAREIRDRHPGFELPQDWSGVVQPDGGVLAADLAIRLHVEGARAGGAEVRENTVVETLEPTGAIVRLRLSDGNRIEAGAVVLAAGAWIGPLVPDLALPLSLSRQPVAWFAPRQPALTGPGRFPVFLLDADADPASGAGADVIYGFPDFAGTGVKAASHVLGRTLANADAARQDAQPQDVAPVARQLARLIPAAAGPLRKTRTCIYTSTPDADFIVDRHPADPRIVIASACSGHGFKFAPVMGEILADLATRGTTGRDISRFSLARFAPG